MQETLSDVRPNRLSERELALIFYIGWPVLFGTILGWTGAGEIGSQLPRPIAIAYWIVGILVVRLALESSIRLLTLVVPKRKTPLVVLCILSVPVHMIFIPPLYYIWQSMFLGYMSEGIEIELSSLWYSSIGAFLASLRSFSMVLVEWTLTNILFDRVLDFPRFRSTTGYISPREEYGGSNQSVEKPTEFELPSFLRRTEWKLGTDVIALSAEDHYVRVHTPLGNDLVFYRFSDAVSAMPKDLGMQIHRSHWVRTSSIENFWKEGNLYRISINEGLNFPVSKRFLGLLKANGLDPKDKS